MSKLKNVTAAEIAALVDSGFDISAAASDYLGRCEQGYWDPIDSPIHKVRALLSTSRALEGMALWLLTKAALGEQRFELEAELRARAKATLEV